MVSDLCATGDHDCEQVCVSSPASYTCACHEGFTLNSDGKTCNGQWAGHRQARGRVEGPGWGLGHTPGSPWEPPYTLPLDQSAKTIDTLWSLGSAESSLATSVPLFVTMGGRFSVVEGVTQS